MNCINCHKRPIANPALSRLDEWSYYLRVCPQCGAEQLKIQQKLTGDEIRGVESNLEALNNMVKKAMESPLDPQLWASARETAWETARAIANISMKTMDK